MRKTATFLLVAALVLAATPAPTIASEQVMMSDTWAMGMCEAWNSEPGLTENLDKWMSNDKGRGYKLMRIYRRDCPDSPWIEMKISKTDDGVVCVGSGWATDEELTGADYVMFADTPRWQEMGAGEYGPMKGMMTGRLKFEGPKFEAMRNMGPFTNFLLLAGKVPGSIDSCPEIVDEEPIMEEVVAPGDEALVEEEGDGSRS
jgi:putative sterol carrier protein